MRCRLLVLPLLTGITVASCSDAGEASRADVAITQPSTTTSPSLEPTIRATPSNGLSNGDTVAIHVEHTPRTNGGTPIIILCEAGGTLKTGMCQVLVTGPDNLPLYVEADPYEISIPLDQERPGTQHVNCIARPCNLVLLATGDVEIASTPVMFTE